MASGSIFVLVVIIALSWNFRIYGNLLRVLRRCELARELALKQVAEERIVDWLCIGFKLNESAVESRGNDSGASTYYGIFYKTLGIFSEHGKEIGDGFPVKAVTTSSSEYLNENVLSKATMTEMDVEAPVGKVYEKCELAIELRDKFNLPEEQIPNWVCIAFYLNQFNTSAEGHSNADDSHYHGLFQISDNYWCSNSSTPGKGCEVTCEDMRNSDISDDVRCIQKIYDEHQNISGNGFNAWTVYKKYCQSEENFIQECSDTQSNEYLNENVTSEAKKTEVGKVYEKCELAIELRDNYSLPEESIPTWICILFHESGFDTSAVGKLNTDGSLNHGLFQINDLYWCSNSNTPGKACEVTCEDMRNSDISDDIRCIQKIYDEHQNISSNGFNAWAAFEHYCQNMEEIFHSIQDIDACFNEPLRTSSTTPRSTRSTTQRTMYSWASTESTTNTPGKDIWDSRPTRSTWTTSTTTRSSQAGKTVRPSTAVSPGRYIWSSTARDGTAEAYPTFIYPRPVVWVNPFIINYGSINF